MGHTRLGKIPKSRHWATVVQSVTSVGQSYDSAPAALVDNIDEIAQQTLVAADGALKTAINDGALQYTFFLLTQIALASRSTDWQGRLKELGMNLNSDSSLTDLTIELQMVIDEYVFRGGIQSDISEMAQQAAGEAIYDLAQDKSFTLFGSNLEDVRIAIKELSTKTGFSRLGQKFFGSFIARFLNFYLSRITASYVNGTSLQHIGDINTFNEALRLHCEQSAKIVYDFSGEWYSKTEYLEGINLENVAGFVAVAVKKLQAELRQQGDEA